MRPCPQSLYEYHSRNGSRVRRTKMVRVHIVCLTWCQFYEGVFSLVIVIDIQLAQYFSHVGCPAPCVVSFPLSGIILNNFTHCRGWRQRIIHHPSEIAKVWWKTKCVWFMIIKIRLRYVPEGSMIDLHSVFAFFHKAKWTELAITHEINRMLGENLSTIRPSGNMFGCLSYQLNNQTLLSSPNRNLISLLRIASPLYSQRSLLFEFAPLLRRWWCRNRQCFAVWRRPWDGNCGILSGVLTVWLSLKNRSRSKSTQTFGASTVNQTPRWQYIVSLTNYWEID
jgi:hypothetical protein